MQGNNIRHILNRHGEGKEQNKDQSPVTPDDLLRIPDILSNPDTIKKGTPTAQGVPSVLYEKADETGKTVVVEVVSTKGKKLLVKTMWKKKPDIDHASSADRVYTSETGAGESSSTSTNNIPDLGKNNNLKASKGADNKEKSLVWAQAAGLQLPGAVPTRDSSSTSNIQHSEAEVNSGDDNIRYSLVGKATDKLAEKVGIKKASNPNIKIEGKEADANGTLTISDWMFTSPSRIAKRVPGFTQFFRYADNAMRKLTKLRYEWNKELIDAFELVSQKSERDQLFEVLWRGDMEGKEWTKQELLEQEKVPESVANAYERIRKMMYAVYEQLNAARRQTQTHSKNITDAALEKLKANKFVEVIKATPGEEVWQLVTWKEAANWQKD